jgi:hypothetical protein
LELPNLEPKADAYDYLKSHTPEDLQKLIDITEPQLKIAGNIKFDDLHRTDSGNADAIAKIYGDVLMTQF